MASEADDDGFIAVNKKHSGKNQPSQLDKWQSSNQFSALRSDRNIDIESSTVTTQHSNAAAAVLTPSQQDAIAHLLRVCAENNVAINPHLRKAILGEELYDEATCGTTRGISKESLSKRESLLGSLIASHLTDLAEESLGETALQVRAKINALENTNISVEARVKNGRYEVIVPGASKSGVIETVATSGAMVKMARRISGGKVKEKTKVIMEGVNLYLEEGKMYLVLGAPGKSFVECALLLLLLLLMFSLY